MNYFSNIVESFRKRNHYYDLLKFIAIVFVCISHINFLIDSSYYWFNNLVFLLELPLFFFVTGILQYYSKRYTSFKDYMVLIIRRLICYLLPFVTFQFFKCVLYNDYPNFFNRIYDNICYPFNGLWFLLGMFIISFILETSKYLLTRKEWHSKYYYPFILPFVSGGLWLLFSRVLNILPLTAYFRLCLYYSIYILFGYYLHLFKDVLINKKLLIRNVHIISFILSLIAFIFIIFFFRSIYEFDDTNIGLIVVRIFGSATGIIIVSTLSNLLVKYKSFQCLSFGGIFTLQIYYLHILFQPFIPNMGELSVFSQFGITALWNILFVVGPIAVVHILYFLPYANFIVFGSHYSFYQFEMGKKLFHYSTTK